MTEQELKDFLESKTKAYQSEEFIETDPIQVPHEFTNSTDIEISGLISALLAWGRRDLIIRSSRAILQRMDYAPFDFVMNASESELSFLRGFRHRTFMGKDIETLVLALRRMYNDYSSLEEVFLSQDEENLKSGLLRFHHEVMKTNHEKRFEKHIANPEKGSAAKRLNMFLRWMVRQDSPVDFGIWKQISPAQLSIPLDVHSGRVARALGLLDRKQNDWKAVERLDISLRKLDPLDPVKYDFALFGLGVFESFK
mgnify:CR=1 FL=1